MTGQELVTLALDRLADGSPAKLVRRLRLGEVMDAVDPAAQVRRWRDGKHDPSYAVTMRLLDGLDMLREPPSSAVASGVSTGDLPRSFEGQVAMLSQLMRETIAALREARPADAATPGSPPRAERKAQ